MPTPLTTASLTATTAYGLHWLRDHGFSYFKSYKHFRQPIAGGHAYIAINTVAHNRHSCHLAFYIGVQLSEVQTLVKQTLGQPVRLTHHDRTIWNYTVNIGPTSRHWPYPTAGTWTFAGLHDFVTFENEIAGFIRDLALHFLAGNSTPEQIRRTLIETPSHATNIWPYREILAIDALYGPPHHLEDDIQLLSERYGHYAAHPRQEFEDFVALIRARVAT